VLERRLSLIAASCLLTAGCFEKEVNPRPVKTSSQVHVPGQVPSFVKLEHTKKIDWSKKVQHFASEKVELTGNPNKSAYLGPQLQVNQPEKWMWLFWKESGSLMTIAAFHKNSGTFEPILYDGTEAAIWSRNGLGSAIHGANLHTPSNVMLPKAGEWALLVYIDQKLFDVLLIDVIG
jgi:hypothetical protein